MRDVSCSFKKQRTTTTGFIRFHLSHSIEERPMFSSSSISYTICYPHLPGNNHVVSRERRCKALSASSRTRTVLLLSVSEATPARVDYP